MLFVVAACAQQLSGHVFSSTNQPVVDAVISSPGCTTVRSGADGRFTIEGVVKGNALTVWHDGFYQQSVIVYEVDAQDLKIYMVETGKSRFNETVVLPFNTVQGDASIASADNINRKDFALDSMSVDHALQGELTGLQVTNKSGMTGEGAYMQLRGIRSLVADNAPLIVICPMPT